MLVGQLQFSAAFFSNSMYNKVRQRYLSHVVYIANPADMLTCPVLLTRSGRTRRHIQSKNTFNRRPVQDHQHLTTDVNKAAKLPQKVRSLLGLFCTQGVHDD